MRMAIQPKFARESSDAFWRKANRLVAADPNVRKAALQKWFPIEPAYAAAMSEEQREKQQQQAAWVGVIKRFSYIFDRHSATKNFRASKAVQIMPATASSSTVADETEAARDDFVASDAGAHQRLEQDEDLIADLRNSNSDSTLLEAAASLVGGTSGGVRASTKRQRKPNE